MRNLISFLWVILFLNGVLIGQDKKSSFPTTLRNLTEIAKSLKSGEDNDVHLGNYTGFDLSNAPESNLIAKILEVNQSQDIEVFDVGFPVISTQATGGLESNFNLSINQISSEKFILFCFVPSIQTGKLVDFYVNIVDNTSSLTQEHIVFLNQYIKTEVEQYFQNRNTMMEIYDAEAFGLSILLNEIEDDSDIQFEREESTEGKIEDDENDFIGKYAGNYVSPSGKLIRLPSNTASPLFTNKNIEGGFPVQALFGFRIKNDSKITRYYAVRKKSDPAYAQGYARKIYDQNHNFKEWKYFIYPTPLFEANQTYQANIGFVTDACGSFSITPVNYTQPFIDNDRKCQGLKITSEELFENIPQSEISLNMGGNWTTALYPANGTSLSTHFPCAPFLTQAMFDGLRVKKAIFNPQGFGGTIHYTETGIFYYYITDDAEDIYLFQYDHSLSKWKSLELIQLTPFEHFLMGLKKAGDHHLALDLVGTFEYYGSIADLLNGIIYFIEGDDINALISVGAAVPFIGLEFTAGKWTWNGSKQIAKAFGYVDEFGQFHDEAGELLLQKIEDLYLSNVNISELLSYFRNKDFYELTVAFLKNPELVKAWETLISHPLIRKDVATLKSASKILDNTGIANIISKTDLQTTVQKLAEKGVRCRTCASGNPAYRYMDEILDDLEHGATKFGNEYTSVVTGFKQGGNFTEGAMFVADAVRRYGDDFPPGTLFEFTEVTAGGVRRVDVRVGDIFYEFKSNTSPPLFGFEANQFIKDMDLGAVSDLGQLKWWFDGNKVSSLPKQQFLDQLTNNPPSAQIIERLRLKFASDGDDWLDVVDAIDDNFGQIFSIK